MGWTHNDSDSRGMFSNLQFGPVKDYSLSHLGIALKNSAGEMVSYDAAKDAIVNVDLIDIKAGNMAYKIPCAIKDVKKGDVILHTNGHAVFVTDVSNGITVIDIAENEKKEILPTKSMFGFDFVTKIVSLIDFSGMNASENQPFGNLLPLMMLSNGQTSMRDILPMLMLTGNNDSAFGNFDMSNPLFLMAFMGDGGSESNSFFQMMILNQMMSGQTSSVVQRATEKTNS